MVIAAPRHSGCAVSHWPRPTIKCATTKNDLERVGENTASSCYGEEPHGFFRKSNLSSPSGFAYCPSRRGFVLLVDSMNFEIRFFWGDFLLWYFVFIGHWFDGWPRRSKNRRSQDSYNSLRKTFTRRLIPTWDTFDYSVGRAKDMLGNCGVRQYNKQNGGKAQLNYKHLSLGALLGATVALFWWKHVLWPTIYSKGSPILQTYLRIRSSLQFSRYLSSEAY